MKKNQSQVQGKETTLGERPIRIYIYEALNRLIHATGKAKRQLRHGNDLRQDERAADEDPEGRLYEHSQEL